MCSCLFTIMQISDKNQPSVTFFKQTLTDELKDKSDANGGKLKTRLKANFQDQHDGEFGSTTEEEKWCLEVKAALRWVSPPRLLSHQDRSLKRMRDATREVCRDAPASYREDLTGGNWFIKDGLTSRTTPTASYRNQAERMSALTQTYRRNLHYRPSQTQSTSANALVFVINECVTV